MKAMRDITDTIPASGQVVRDSSLLKPSRSWLPLAMLSAATVALATLVWRGRAGRSAPDLQIVRCPIHGIAYDAQLEVCPECAKPASADIGPSGPIGTL
jgi:hypothetical protein